MMGAHHGSSSARFPALRVTAVGEKYDTFCQKVYRLKPHVRTEDLMTEPDKHSGQHGDTFSSPFR